MDATSLDDSSIAKVSIMKTKKKSLFAWFGRTVAVGLVPLMMFGCANNSSSDNNKDSIVNQDPPTFSTDPSEDDVITGTSVLKITFNESVSGVANGTNVVLKNANGIEVDMDHTAPTSGNTYTFDPNPDLTSGTYYLNIGQGSAITDGDGQAANSDVIVFRVDDARMTVKSAMTTAGVSAAAIAAAGTAVTADGVTNNLLTVIPAAISAGIGAATTSADKQLVISSAIGAANGAASLTSTADRTITRITDTANFELLLTRISEALTALAVANDLSATELGAAIATVNNSLDEAGADSDQLAGLQGVFNAAINEDIASETSLSTDYGTEVLASTESSGASLAGETFVLTDSIDTTLNFTGGAGDDIFIITSATDDAGDEIDGAGGTDTIRATLSTTLAAISARNIETVQVKATTGATTLDLDYVPEATKVINLSSSAALTISNAASLTTVDINGAANDTIIGASSATDQALTVNVAGVEDADDADFDVDTTATNDIVSLTLNVTSDSSFADLRADEVETLTINATGDLEVEDATEIAALTDLVITGTGAVTLTDLTDGALIDNVSHTNSSALNIELLNSTNLTVVTSSGDDRIAVTDAQLSSNDSIDLGGGTDTLAIGVANSATMTLTSAIMGIVSNVEIIELATEDGAAGIDTVTLDAAELHNKFTVGVINDGSDSIDDTYEFDSVSSGVEVIISDNISTIDVDLETASGTADEITLTINSSVVGGTKIDGKVDVDDFETVNIAVTGTTALTIDDVDADAATAINITGSAPSLTFTDISDITATTVIDASEFAGGFTISLLGEAPLTINGSSTGGNSIALAAGGLAQGKTYTAGSSTVDNITVTSTSNQAMGILDVTGFERINLTTEGTTGAESLDLRNAQDLVTLSVTSGGANDDLTVNRISGDTTLAFTSTTAIDQVVTDLSSGTSQKIAFTGAVTVASLTLDTGATSLTVTSDNGNATADQANGAITSLTGASLTSITVLGADRMDLGTLGTTMVTVNAADATGKLTVTASATATTITGSSVADALTGGTGADTINGGGGADVINTGANATAIGETINPGAGADIVTIGNTDAAGSAVVQQTLAYHATAAESFSVTNATTSTSMDSLTLSNPNDDVITITFTTGVTSGQSNGSLSVSTTAPTMGTSTVANAGGFLVYKQTAEVDSATAGVWYVYQDTDGDSILELGEFAIKITGTTDASDTESFTVNGGSLVLTLTGG